MNNRQIDDNQNILDRACQQLKINYENIQCKTFDQFYEENKHKYNMDKEAWEILWENNEQKKHQQFLLLQQYIEDEQKKVEQSKKESYSKLINQLWSGNIQKIEQTKLDKLHSGNLKELRFHVEQQIAQLTKKNIKFVPRYKEVNLNNEKLNQTHDPNLETELIKFKKPLEQKKQIDPNYVFVGIDKLAPRAIKINQYEFDVENYSPEDDINQELEQELLNQIEEELRQGIKSNQDVTNNVRKPYIKQKKGDQILQVQKRNQEIIEEKRTKLIQKQFDDDERLQNVQMEKQKYQKQKIISNFMKQQDKQDNLQRQQLLDQHNIQLLQQKIDSKKNRILQFETNKQKFNSKKLQFNRVLDDYEIFLQNMMEDYQDGIVDENNLDQALQIAPITIKNQNKKDKLIKNISKKKQNSYKLQQEIINLEQKHNLEIRMIIEREKLAEQNRQKKINQGISDDVLNLFEQQRLASQKRIQNILTKQQLETQNLMRLYSR